MKELDFVVTVNPNPPKERFDELLDRTLAELNSQAKKSPKKTETLLGRQLEPYVKGIMTDMAVGTDFEGTIELIGGQKFPDIISNKYYGVEVKTTTQNHWKTTGNSVMEGTRVNDIGRVYMLFAKLASPIEFRCRPYEEVLYEVVVTHSPRYLVDMNLSKGDTIFDKINLSYDTLRTKENPIKPIVEYYKSKLKPGEELWWMDNQNKTDIQNLVIKSWNCLPKTEQNELTINGIAFFPELFGATPDKYSRFAFWLVSSQSVVCPNTRDIFSAGGKKDVIVNGKIYEKVPATFATLFDFLPEVTEAILLFSADELSQKWDSAVTEDDKLFVWAHLVGNFSKQIKKGMEGLDIEQMILQSIFK